MLGQFVKFALNKTSTQFAGNLIRYIYEGWRNVTQNIWAILQVEFYPAVFAHQERDNSRQWANDISC